MMARVRGHAVTGQMGMTVLDIPAFPGERFGMGFPEAIGDMNRTGWLNQSQPEWTQLEDGAWKQTGRGEGELSYELTVEPQEDYVDVRQSVTNQSNRDWPNSVAFNCFQCGGAPSIRDHECVRHWVATGGELKRLPNIPRQFSPRPTVQLYSVEGAPVGMDLPFVANFHATPDVVLEGWMAIESRDGKRLVAAVSKPAMFLFQNMEYSCIHSGAGFGPLRRGETGKALTRLYFVEASVEEWYGRMKGELG